LQFKDEGRMRKMINWQGMDDDGNTSCYSPVRIIASIPSFFYLLLSIFAIGFTITRYLKRATLPCPVISVGNITVVALVKLPV